MSESASKPVYYVNAYSEPILVRIEGRASFQNSAGLKDFLSEMIRQGKGAFVIDFLRCTGMDSTFLGVLAGAALVLRKKPGRNSLVLVRVGPRNLELIRNLGLHRLLTVDCGEYAMNFDKGGAVLPGQDRTELENARLVLEAHENLVAAEGGNAAKFQDVLVFLRSRVEGS
jgi:anti-anti-sigma regulatory factor